MLPEKLVSNKFNNKISSKGVKKCGEAYCFARKVLSLMCKYFHFSSLLMKKPNHSGKALEVNDKVIENADMWKSLQSK